MCHLISRLLFALFLQFLPPEFHRGSVNLIREASALEYLDLEFVVRMSGLSEFGQTGLPLLDFGVIFGRRGEVLFQLLDYGRLLISVVVVFLGVEMGWILSFLAHLVHVVLVVLMLFRLVLLLVFIVLLVLCQLKVVVRLHSVLLRVGIVFFIDQLSQILYRLSLHTLFLLLRGSRLLAIQTVLVLVLPRPIERFRLLLMKVEVARLLYGVVLGFLLFIIVDLVLLIW